VNAAMKEVATTHLSQIRKTTNTQKNDKHTSTSAISAARQRWNTELATSVPGVTLVNGSQAQDEQIYHMLPSVSMFDKRHEAADHIAVRTWNSGLAEFMLALKRRRVRLRNQAPHHSAYFRQRHVRMRLLCRRKR
jgi:hypothetical protein